MILTAHQPVYMPWLGLFHKISICDVFCFFDIVQYQRRDFNNRNKINTPNGPIWLTVPVFSKGRLESNIKEVIIKDDGWREKHIRSLETSYGKSPFFDEYFSGLFHILRSDQERLVDLNYDLLKFFLKCLEIDTPIVRASSYNFEGTKSDLVLDMCLKLGAKTYVFGKQGKNYADLISFEKVGVKVYFQNYKHPNYLQKQTNFERDMSVVDLLFNHGKSSRNILLQNNIPKSEVSAL